MKLIEKHKAEVRDMKRFRVTKKESNAKNLAKSKNRVSTLDQERKLKKTATRGVVTLFNAIMTHQREARKKDKEERAEKKEKSDEVMAPVMAAGHLNTQPVAAAGAAGKAAAGGGGWDVLKDDFMMEAKMKDWDRDEEEAELQSKGKGKKDKNNPAPLNAQQLADMDGSEEEEEEDEEEGGKGEGSDEEDDEEDDDEE